MSKKTEQYQLLEERIQALLLTDQHWLSLLSNFIGQIFDDFKHHWVGFYLLGKDKNKLILGPYQGPPACDYIPYGRGVCGKSWELKKTIIVSNVHEFPGHIACSALSVSEIVVPLFDTSGELWGVLDIDSLFEGEFSLYDQERLERLTSLLSKHLSLPLEI